MRWAPNADKLPDELLSKFDKKLAEKEVQKNSDEITMDDTQCSDENTDTDGTVTNNNSNKKKHR